MKCPKCNSPAEEGAVFCEVCGAPLREKKSRLPVVIIFLILMVGIIAGISVWIVLGDYHAKDSKKEISAKIEAYAGDSEETAKRQESRESGQREDRSPEQDDAGKDEKENAGEEKKVDDSEEGGIHRYEFFISDCTWSEAYRYCLDEGGYLARINSQEEFDYIVNEIEAAGMQDIQFRIGGRRGAGADEYYWVNERNELYGDRIDSDQYWCAGQWMTNEPSYRDGNTEETCLDIFYYQGEGRWVFNDVPDNIISVVPEFTGKIGYICEYEDE